MKTIQGVVTSLKNEQTAIVTVVKKWQHPIYKKFVKRSKNYACHVDGLKLELGQEVAIKEVKPLSKTKRFVVSANVEDKS